MKWKDIVQKIVLFCKIYLYVPEILPNMFWPFFNVVMGVEVNSYDLKACHPLGPVSQNQKCGVIVKFVYFDIKNRIMAGKSY